jgi:hypothetical protein
MRITKAGDSVWCHRSNQITGLADRFDGLQRQAVHKIKVQAGDPRRPQALDCHLYHDKRLKATDRSLNKRIDILHTKTCSSDPQFRQRLRQRRRNMARVEFNCVFKAYIKRELAVDRRDDGSQPARPENAGRTTAPMQPRIAS